MAKVADEGSDVGSTAVNGPVSLAYRVLGEPDAEPLLLICGMGTQMLHWPDELVTGLVERGFRVAMFDNRDSGRSTHCAELAPYDLDDMAADALAVLDALGWPGAHLVGVSLGGMIGQALAVRHPSRVRTLTSISSAPGWGMRISRPNPLTTWKIIALARRAGEGRAAAADHAVALFGLLGAPGQALDEEWLRDTTLRAYDIAHDPTAGRRHLAACRAGGDRRKALGAVRAPTLVVHGRDDPAQSVTAAGRATAEAIPGARFMTVAGGHVLPADAWREITPAIAELARAGAR